MIARGHSMGRFGLGPLPRNNRQGSRLINRLEAAMLACFKRPNLEGAVSNLYWLNEEQMARLRPFFPKSHGKPRVDDRRVLSGIILNNRNGLRCCDAPKEYGPAKTLYDRWKWWDDMGVLARMMDGLASEAATPKTMMIDATYLKAHRTASSLGFKKGGATMGGGV